MVDFFYEILQKKDSERCMFIKGFVSRASFVLWIGWIPLLIFEVASKFWYPLSNVPWCLMVIKIHFNDLFKDFANLRSNMIRIECHFRRQLLIFIKSQKLILTASRGLADTWGYQIFNYPVFKAKKRPVTLEIVFSTKMTNEWPSKMTFNSNHIWS